jgi:hypothetical protein
MSALPAAVYVGCQRTGSAFLRSYFTFHPGLSWSRHGTYFQREGFTPEGYRALFADASSEAVLVDMYESIAMGYVFRDIDAWNPDHAVLPAQPIDGNYIVPAPEVVVERVQRALPHARIVMTIRNQVDWVRSNYLHFLGWLPHRHRGLSDFLSTREGKLVLFAGLFDRTIALYQQAFGRDRVHVLPMERLHRHEDESLAALCAFLGVAPLPFRGGDRNLNTGVGVVSGNLMRLAARLGVNRRLAGMLRPLQKPVKLALSPVLERDVLTAADRSLIAGFYAASNYLSSSLLDVDLNALGYPL